MLSRLARPQTQRPFHHLPVPPNRLVSATASLRPTSWRFNSTSARRRRHDKTQTTQLFPTSRSRSVATAASPSETSIPFEQSQATDATAHDFLHGPKPTSPAEESRPLVVRQDLISPAPRLPYIRGIGGDLYDLFSNLTASLRVRRMERAEAILARLREVYKPTASELLHAHNTVLGAQLQMLERQHPDYTFTKILKWVVVNIQDNDITPNVKTFVLLIKACVASEQGLKLSRSLRRVFTMVERLKDFDVEVLNNPELFTEEEFAKLQAELSDYFEDLSKKPVDGGASQFSPAAASTLLQSAKPNVSSLPDLRSVRIKGAGLETVKKSLSLFQNPELAKEIPYPDDFHDLTEEQKTHLWNRQRQIRLEEDGVDAAVGRWRLENETMQKLGIASALSTKPMEALMWQWYSALIPAMQEELRLSAEAINSESSADQDRSFYGAYLETFTAERLAALTLLVLVPMIGSKKLVDGTKVVTACVEIGKHLATEYGASTSKEFSQDFPDVKASKSPEGHETTGDDSQLTESSYEAMGELRSFEWGTALCAKVGAMLLSKVFEVAKVQVDRVDPESGKQYTVNEPAFFHQTEYRKGRKVGVIKLHPVVRDKLKREPLRGSIGSKYPMVVEPLPWTGFRKGGYFRYPQPVIKATASEDQRLYCLAAVQRGDMKDVLRGLTVLGKTAWKVNHDVFKVMIEVWNSGEELASIAPENPQIEYPSEPGLDATKRQVAEYMKAKQKINNLRAAYHSQRCFQNFQLEVAHAFKDEVFYFPHNIDFRGRAYPLPALLNHMGADMARGILTFAQGKELGEVGLRWLKIHLANVYGFDKASLSDREEFAMEHLNEVYDSAEKPLSGRRWWLRAEDPWQCLATCFELKHAFDSPDPIRYVSHLPVHQDGTCNGLQHYAALGGDQAGAAQVNLQPGDKPSDIYTTVAELVKAEVIEDAAHGNVQAIAVKGKITRKVVKQTVMTNVYGVTFVGAREQVQNRLEELMTDGELQKGGGKMKVSSYVARLIFKALGRMFNGAQAIQDWLGTCADRIATSLTPEQIKYIESRLTQSKTADNLVRNSRFKGKPLKGKSGKILPSVKKRAEKPDWVSKTHAGNISLQFRSPVIWTTPLKMPVVQPYRSVKSKAIPTKVQTMSLRNPDEIAAVNRRKQLQAFPPNFIHSLDASHMFLSAIKSHEVGLTFSSVHDSFWTHAADVPIMNRILRDAFVAMHSEDIIGRMHEEFTVRYRGSMYLASVHFGSPLAKQITQWRRQNKGIKMLSELCMEHRRWELLNSGNEEDRQKGREMVTPAALYEKAVAEHPEWLQNPTDQGSGVTKLGQQQSKSSSFVSAVDPTQEDDVVDEGDDHIGLPGEQDIINEIGMMATDETRAEADAADAAAGTDASAADALAGTDATTAAESNTESNTEASDSSTKKPSSKKKKYHSNELRKFWLPMSFPPVPEKGEFDVRVLRDSQYFFS